MGVLCPIKNISCFKATEPMKHPVRIRTLLLGGIVLLFAVSTFAQSRAYRWYETQSYQKKLYNDNPELKMQAMQLEEYISLKQNNIQTKKFSIGVVFHILQGPESPELSRQDILEQLAILNQDFSREKTIRHKADTLEGFFDRASKMEITFCFPKEAPDGTKKEDAIYYYQSDTSAWGIGNNMKAERTGGADPWDPVTHLNIWVVDLKRNRAGFAQMPGGPSASDGIVIDYDFFGLKGDDYPYNLGKSLTHLVGSYLGLHELWNFYDRCADDGVADTPIHNDPNFGDDRYRQVSTCYRDRMVVEMTMNFMDNTDDALTYMFTLGQKARINAIIQDEGPRAGLDRTKTFCDDLPELLVSSPEEKGDDILRVFPNPADDRLRINLGLQDFEGDYQFLVLSTQGETVMQLSGRAGNVLSRTIDCSRWPAGIYVVQLRIGEKSFSKKVNILQ